MHQRAPDEGPSAGFLEFAATTDAQYIRARRTPCPVSRRLSEIVVGRRITSTSAAIDAFNRAAEPSEVANLYGLLRSYTSMPEALLAENVLEYAELAKVQPRSDGDRRLARTVVESLVRSVADGELPEANVARAVHRALMSADPDTFAKWAGLAELTMDLLSKLNRRPRLTSANFEQHEPTFLALQQLLLLLLWDGAHRVSQRTKRQIQSRLRTKILELTDSREYFPVEYYMMFFEQALRRLEPEDTMPAGMRVLHRLAAGVWCVVFFVGGIAYGECCNRPGEWQRRMQGAMELCGERLELWFDRQLALSQARRQLERGGSVEALQTAIAEALAYMREPTLVGHKRALKYGITSELCRLALEARNADGRRVGASVLLQLAVADGLREQWQSDAALLEKLLDSLSSVWSQRFEHRPDVFAALQALLEENEHSRETARRWLAGMPLERRLRRSEASSESESVNLFRLAMANHSLLPCDVAENIVAALRSLYLHPDFTTVGSPFRDGRPPLNVNDFECSLVRYDEESVPSNPVPAEGRNGDDADVKVEDHVAMYHGRRQTPRPLISLNHLFGPATSVSEVERVRGARVLVYGDPGVGKTCMSKAIAHRWAAGDLLESFETVCLVPVRRLNAFGAVGVERGPALSAILGRVFSVELAGFEPNLVNLHLAYALQKRSTLLILDGIDEANEFAARWINEAMTSRCSILMFSRPYNLNNALQQADTKVECIGFDDTQLVHYVRRDCGEHSEGLLLYMRQNQDLWRIAHVPLMASILCTLRISERAQGDEDMATISLYALYMRMATYLWNRYEQLADGMPRDGLAVFNSLGQIALAALESGRILFERGFVDQLFLWRTHLLDNAIHAGFLLLRLEGDRYQFPHFTFQEFFAGTRLARLLREGNVDERRGQAFVSKNKYHSKFQLTFRFTWQALLNDRARERAFAEAAAVVDLEPRDFLGVHHLLLKLRVVDALSEAEDSIAREIAIEPGALFTNTRELLSVSQVGSHLWDVVLRGLIKMRNVLPFLGGVFRPQLVRDRFRDWLRHSPTQLVAALTSLRNEDALVAAVLDACSDDDGNIRRFAVEIIPSLIAAYLDVAAIWMQALAQIAASEVWQNRQLAAHAYAEIARSTPALVLAEEETLLRGLATDNFNQVRLAAVHVIVALVEAEAQPGVFLTTVSEALTTDLVPAVQNAAVQLIPAIFRLSPELREHWTNVILTRAQDDVAAVRRSALLIIRELIRALPASDHDWFQMVEAGTEDAESIVRTVAVEALGELMTADPDRAISLLPRLTGMSTDEVWQVRGAVLQAAANLIAASPHLAVAFEETFRTMGEDVQAENRRSVAVSIEEIVRIHPQTAPTWYATVSIMVRAQNPFTERNAMRALAEIVGAVPAAAPLASELLFQANAVDEDGAISQSALPAAVALILVSPELPWSRLLDQRTRADAPNLRLDCVASVVELARASPILDAPWPNRLREMTSDGSDAVRRAAIRAVLELIKATPATAPFWSEALEARVEDPDTSVLRTVLEAAPYVVEADHATAEGWSVRLNGKLQDVHAEVRSAAADAVVKVLRAEPESAASFATGLAAAVNDANAAVRGAAVEAIRSLSCQRILSFLQNAQPEAIATLLGTKLVDCAVLVRGPPVDGCVRLTEISQTGNVGEGAVREDVLQMALASVGVAYPGILQLRAHMRGAAP